MPGLLNPDSLAGLDHSTLFNLRERYKDKALQDLLAGYEHRAFAREAVGDNPLMALPIALAAPLYQASKLISPSRSDPSWGQLGHGLLGVGEGLLAAIRR